MTIREVFVTAKAKLVTLMRSVPTALTGGKWVYSEEKFDVRVMAIAEGYAMVRRPGCAPFVVSVKQLGVAPNKEVAGIETSDTK